MSVLPIVARELRVAARRHGTYWTRVLMAAGATAIGACILLFSLYASPQKVGYYVFLGLAGLSMLFCLAYGRHSTADCLSSEKREGTLGLLFLTDLKGLDVVLGKLAATSAAGLYGLLAIFPVLAIPLLMGGITSGEFWRIALVLVNTFLFSLSIGIFVSSLCWDVRRAMGANFLVLLFLIGIPPAVAFFIAALNSQRSPAELFLSCPVYSFYLSLAGPYKLHSADFWKSVALQHSLMWLMLCLASRIVPRTWQDRPVQTEKASWKGRWRSLQFGSLAGQLAFRREALDINAFYWLAARARLKPLQVWVFLGGMLLWWLAGWLFVGRIWFDIFTYVITALLLNTTFKIWLMIEASQRLAADHKAGALELLLSTPLSVRNIVHGQWLALYRQFARPLLAVLAIELLLLLVIRRVSPESGTTTIWLAGMVMLVLDLVAAGWVAMWMALKSKTPHQATLGTVTRILVLPWVMLGMVTGVAGIWAFALGNPWEPTWKFSLSLWVGFGLLADLVFGLHARSKLLSSFRRLALQRLAAEPHPRRIWRPRLREAKPAAAVVRTRRTLWAWTPFRILRRKKFSVPLGLILLLAGLWIAGILPRPASKFPPPPLVSLGHSNGAFRVVPSNPGLLLVLPDHSLWSWGAAIDPVSKQPKLERLGTDSDWLKVIPTHNGLLGLRTNGTLWHWKWSELGATPLRFDSGEDYTDFASLRAGAYVVALRRDGTLWQWGKRLPAGGGGLLVPGESPPEQVGTNADWAAVSAYHLSATALRKDGSLWVWGLLYTFVANPNIMPRQTLVAEPTRLCRETNWLMVTDSYPPFARNSAGEAWEMTGMPPDPEAPASIMCRQLVTNALTRHFATAFTGDRKAYEIRNDGTLWERDCPFGVQNPSASGRWQRVGKRNDWVSLHPAGPTTLGTTADGSVWLWGYDPSRIPRANLAGTFRILHTRLNALFSGKPPVTFGPAGSPFFQDEPRPILRLAPPPPH